MKTMTKFWICIGVLIIISPLGFILPEHFKAGSAWGEWSPDEIKGFIGYIPHGFKKLSGLWSAPLSGYTLRGWEKNGLWNSGFAYILSALVGIIIVVMVLWLFAKVFLKKDERDVQKKQ